MEYHGQPRLTAQDVGAVALPEEVNHAYGSTVALLTKPAGANLLVLVAESGSFRLKAGDHGSLSSAAPSGSVTDGTGSLLLPQGATMTIPAPAELTVKGSAGTAILTYFWV